MPVFLLVKTIDYLAFVFLGDVTTPLFPFFLFWSLLDIVNADRIKRNCQVCSWMIAATGIRKAGIS